MGKEKFSFNKDFQQSVLQFIVTDKHGYKALKLIKDFYFTLLEHQIIAKVLISYFKTKRRVGSKVIIRERLRVLYQTKDFANALNPSDKKLINKILKKIYSGNVKDGDTILEECIRFSRFVETKEVLEGADVEDYNNYESLANKLQKAINAGGEFEDNKGVWLIRDIRDRQYKRQIEDPTHPTPFKQVNWWLNNGGFTRHSLIALLGPAKRFKTGGLINLARGYLRLRKKVLYVDLENGDEALATRAEQSFMKKSAEDIYSGLYDTHTQKQFRKYKRLGAELVIKRFPAYSTNCNNIQNFIDDIYREYGVKFDVIMFDYGDLLGAISGVKEDTQRISDAYLDMKNLLEYNDFETGWTGSHVTRDGAKRESTKFKQNDLAKAIDKMRHSDAIFGLNQNDEEKKLGVLRWEIVDQRQGKDSGTAYFWIDKGLQRMDEFTNTEIEEMRKQEVEYEEENRNNASDL